MADHKPSPSEGGDSKSLAHQINVAIASSHTKINRLILDRMPKAVPPQTGNPSTYITGLLHIGAVYIAFESLWQNILGIHYEIAPIPYTYPFTDDPGQHDETPKITERTRHVLEQAYWPALSRAARIKSDIRSLTGWPDHVIDEQIRSAGTSGRLGHFTLHIRDTVNAKPHLLLAYAYCLYLALLSGGSYIRTELMYLKSDFWQETPTPIMPNMVECKPSSGPKKSRRRSSSTVEDDTNPHGLARHDPAVKVPLEFLDFDPPLGENPRQQTKELKAEFKRRFAGAEHLLADLERKDIVGESNAIFSSLEGVVDQLDHIFATVPASPTAKSHVQRALQPPAHSPRGGTISLRLRDSIAIAKGKLLRTRRKSSGGSAVAATGLAVEDTPTTPTDTHESPDRSSKPSTVSSSSLDELNVSHHEGDPPPASSGDLARGAVVPGEGFRTIRYDGDVSSPGAGRSGKKHKEKKEKKDKNTGESHVRKQQQHGLDGAGSYEDIEEESGDADERCCPMTTTTKTTAIRREAQKGEGSRRDYVLYAVVSNFVLLVGVAAAFGAWLYVKQREEEGREIRGGVIGL